jgi:hypothetical protein
MESKYGIFLHRARWEIYFTPYKISVNFTDIFWRTMYVTDSTAEHSMTQYHWNFLTNRSIPNSTKSIVTC